MCALKHVADYSNVEHMHVRNFATKDHVAVVERPSSTRSVAIVAGLYSNRLCHAVLVHRLAVLLASGLGIVATLKSPITATKTLNLVQNVRSLPPNLVCVGRITSRTSPAGSKMFAVAKSVAEI
jgi:hypothetical protein